MVDRCEWPPHASLAAVAPSALAQSIEPRAYSNAPTGVKFRRGLRVHEPRHLLRSLAVTDELHRAKCGYARILDLWVTSGKIEMPAYTALDGTASREHRSRARYSSGMGNPRYR